MPRGQSSSTVVHSYTDLLTVMIVAKWTKSRSQRQTAEKSRCPELNASRNVAANC